MGLRDSCGWVSVFKSGLGGSADLGGLLSNRGYVAHDRDC